MSKTNKERILEYLRSIAPEGATNSQIRQATGTESHQQVFQLTRELMRAGLIRGLRAYGGNEWVFSAIEPSPPQSSEPGRVLPEPMPAYPGERLASRAFEQLARSVMSMHLGIPLVAGQVPGVPKEFDMVSPDKSIMGDAKYFGTRQAVSASQVLQYLGTRVVIEDRRCVRFPRLWQRPASAGLVAQALREPGF